MKLAMTLLVRDEVDILDAHLSFHLNAGVDIVIATDHRSVDGTSELLRSYAREGYVHLIRRDDEKIDQSNWVTHMARLAATEYEADWVINSDVDEFWWPREASLKEVLAAVPDRYGVVRVVSRVFVPRPGEGWFADRMIVRLALAAPINDSGTPYRHVAKAVHRGHAGAVVQQGNHNVVGLPHSEFTGWSPIELLHFPLRSSEQTARKHELIWTAWIVNLRGDLAKAKTAFDAGRGKKSYFDDIVVDDSLLGRGLAKGFLVEDVRLRDVLRRLRAQSGAFHRPGEGPSLCFGPASFAEDASRALDNVLLTEADGIRLQRRADELAARIAKREGGAAPAGVRS
jgi:Glycosyl transferase family 2